MTGRVLGIAMLLVLAGAAPAAAAEVSLQVAPEGGVRFGDAAKVTGRVTEDTEPLAGRTVRLEVRAHPFDGGWRARTTAETDADGRFAFAPRFERNHRIRARLAPVAGEDDATVSPAVDAFVLPAFTLAFTQRGDRGIRLRQVYTVPRDVRLSEPTRFYLGPCEPDQAGECTARRAPFVAAGRTRRVRAGRYVARATVRIPASYAGRFSYVSCFAYSKGSGMGDPGLRCPRRSIRLR
jgi:hypothetical protein